MGRTYRTGKPGQILPTTHKGKGNIEEQPKETIAGNHEVAFIGLKYLPPTLPFAVVWRDIYLHLLISPPADL
jgi:hypothetical protein